MGLGNIGISENYPEVSKDVMESKLSILKKRFLSSYNSDIKERIDRIKRIRVLIEENTDAFHKTLEDDFGTRHEQLSLLADTLPVIAGANNAL